MAKYERFSERGIHVYIRLYNTGTMCYYHIGYIYVYESRFPVERMIYSKKVLYDDDPYILLKAESVNNRL